ncbi:hypothetical protein GCM10020331_046440 [Ectobacillus funiculus]
MLYCQHIIFLQEDPNAIEKHYDEYFKSEEKWNPNVFFKFMQYAYLGVPQKNFSPNYLNTF